VKHTLGLDFPNLPYFIDGDLKLTQSDAILLHVAKQARLMGATDEARALALMLLGVAADLRGPCVPPRGSRAPLMQRRKPQRARADLICAAPVPPCFVAAT
jgi:glutathione S-transferase